VTGYFLDTSAFAKLYHREAGSEFVIGLAERRAARLVVSHFALVEMESVLAIKERTGQIDASAVHFARRRLRSDIRGNRIAVEPVLSTQHLWSARDLLIRFGGSDGLRTLDALQLTSALYLYRLGRIEVIVSADRRLCQVAANCGCPSVDPTRPTIVIR
jgi:predicted nucleic acid-binding protein